MKKSLSMLVAALAVSLTVCAAVPAVTMAAEPEAPLDVAETFTAGEDTVPTDAADESFDSVPVDDEFIDYDIVYDTEPEETSDPSLISGNPAQQEDSRQQNIKDSLKIMGQGMLGIFVVMLLIYLVVVILNAVTKDAEPDGDNDDK